MIASDRPRGRLGAPILMRCGPAEPRSCGGHAYRPVTVTAPDIADLERVWVASQDIDGATFRPATGWWSLADWADAALLLRSGETTIGPGRAPVRAARHRAIAAGRLLAGARALGRDLYASTLRLHLPARAAWARQAAGRHGFVRVRTRALMLRPAGSPLGLGRTLLGRRSVLPGVDADDPAPVALYRSVGFEVIDGVEVWEGCGTTVGALNVEPAGAATNTEDSASVWLDWTPVPRPPRARPPSGETIGCSITERKLA